MKYSYMNVYRITLCALLPVFLVAQVERWVYTYNGNDNIEDCAKAIIYGDDGNIYTVGYCSSNGTNSDFTVISLTSSGIERWVYTYNGQASLADVACDVVYGLDGNIYAVGSSTNTNNMDITILSLTTGGTERWVYTYDGPSNQDDEAFSIVYGFDHNIYVAGRSGGVGTEDDFTIISVDTAGLERWVYRYDRDTYYDGAYSIAYGIDNNIYASGYTYHWIPTQEFTILSVDTAGTQRWMKTIAGGGISNETALFISCGLDTNLYTVGWSYVMSYTVTSIDTAGTWMWRHWYGHIGNNNAARSVIQGQDRSIFSTGHLQIGTHYDLLIAAHSATGDSLWMMLYDGPSQNDDVGQSLDFGNNGRIYAAGYSGGIGSGEDFIVIDVDMAGCLKWVYRYNGTANVSDRANSLVYGSDNCIYAAGYCSNLISAKDFLVISLDTTTTDIDEETKFKNQNKNQIIPTFITGSFPILKNKCYKIFDITGRQIHTLNPAPGIYFIEVDGEIKQKVVKVR